MFRSLLTMIQSTLIKPGYPGVATFDGNGRASPPTGAARPPSFTLPCTSDTTLGRAFALGRAEHPQETAFYPLPQGTGALAVRLALIQAAEKSLDLQCYLLRDDDTGRALLGELVRAADRGVRVRVLLDDIHTVRQDTLLAALDLHPHIEVRLFNPFRHRAARWLDLIFDFSRVNRRMHNKSMTADNQFTIVGGRNIGNEYFAASDGVDFSDFDVLAGGPVVSRISAVFDDYWNSPAAFPMKVLTGRTPPGRNAIRAAHAKLSESVRRVSRHPFAQEPEFDLPRALAERRLEAFWGSAVVIADRPDKITRSARRDAGLAMQHLMQVLDSARQELLLVSPYFVPGTRGTSWLESLARRGIRIRILTNSFLATDVGAVHAGYAAHRVRLLRAGIELYELKPSIYATRKHGRRRRLAGSSQASLHAKTYLVDQQTLFIGSLNLDPRSSRLNTEMGLLVKSPALAARFAGRFDAYIMDFSYQVRLDPRTGSLTWHTIEQEREIRHESEPGVGLLQRAGLFLERLVPMEEHL
jgi:putative cardiolipin synthase